MTIGYCCKCKKMKEMKDTRSSKTKKDIPMIKGICSSCGTKMCRLGK